MRLTLPLTFVALACAGEKSEFATASEFQAAMKEQGWAKLGSFGDLKWPARMTGGQRAMNEISFRTPDGVPHKYPGYTGYELRVVELSGVDGTKGVFVYRSDEKR